MYFISILFISSLTLPFISSSTIVENVTIAPKPPQEQTLSTKEDYIAYAKKLSIQRGIQPHEVIGTIKCESNFNPNAINKEDPNGGSHGIAQFQTKTFDYWSKKAGIENGDMYNPKDAIETMVYMFSQRQQNQWSCWKKLYEKERNL